MLYPLNQAVLIQKTNNYNKDQHRNHILMAPDVVPNSQQFAHTKNPFFDFCKDRNISSNPTHKNG
jgi:hypothetical protein